MSAESAAFPFLFLAGAACLAMLAHHLGKRLGQMRLARERLGPEARPRAQAPERERQTESKGVLGILPSESTSSVVRMGKTGSPAEAIWMSIGQLKPADPSLALGRLAFLSASQSEEQSPRVDRNLTQEYLTSIQMLSEAIEHAEAQESSAIAEDSFDEELADLIRNERRKW